MFESEASRPTSSAKRPQIFLLMRGFAVLLLSMTLLSCDSETNDTSPPTDGIPEVFSNDSGEVTAVTTTEGETKRTIVRSVDNEVLLTMITTTEEVDLRYPDLSESKRVKFLSELDELPSNVATNRLAVFVTSYVYFSDESSYSKRQGLFDEPGCDWFPDAQCTLRCCAEHDACYEANDCNASSWKPRNGSPECNRCNRTVVSCILEACLGGGDDEDTGDRCYDSRCGQFYDCGGANCNCMSPCDSPESCGNGVCEAGETAQNCRNDCAGDPDPPSCNSCGDVHIRTPDGLAYDFQGAGEYLFIASTDEDIVIQTRQEPWGNSKLVSVNTAVAMNVNGDRVGVYIGRTPELYVNGEPTNVTTGTLDLFNGGRIYLFNRASRTEYLVEWPNDFLASVKLRRSYLDVGISKPPALQIALDGLVGNLNSDATDDIRTRDGVPLTPPVVFEDLYRIFGDSWKISPGESLFDYEPGTNTASFQLLDFPLRPATLKDFDQEAVNSARQNCEAAGIEDPVLLEDCILDVAATGELEFVESAVDSEQPETTFKIGGVVNGGFDQSADGWYWENLDPLGGWSETDGNPGGNFIINSTGATGITPKLCQAVTGLVVGRAYNLAGDYASFKPSFGDPAKPNAFAVTLNDSVVLELPRPAPVSTNWTAYSTVLIPEAEEATLCLEAERQGDDSSFRVDNIVLK